VTTRYTVQAISSRIYDAEENKAPRVFVELMVVDGPDKGKVLPYWGSLHENAQQYTFEALRNLGWTCMDITELTGLGSLKAIAVEKTEEYKGKTQVRYSIWPVRTPKPTLEADNKASFAARFKALAASVAPVTKTDINAGLETLPTKLESTGNSTAAPTTGGVPF
jgi:hypothetical protein